MPDGHVPEIIGLLNLGMPSNSCPALKIARMKALPADIEYVQKNGKDSGDTEQR